MDEKNHSDEFLAFLPFAFVGLAVGVGLLGMYFGIEMLPLLFEKLTESATSGAQNRSLPSFEEHIIAILAFAFVFRKFINWRNAGRH